MRTTVVVGFNAVREKDVIPDKRALAVGAGA